MLLKKKIEDLDNITIEELENIKKDLENSIDNSKVMLSDVTKRIYEKQLHPICFETSKVEFRVSSKKTEVGVLKFDDYRYRVLFVPYKKDGTLSQKYLWVYKSDFDNLTLLE